MREKFRNPHSRFLVLLAFTFVLYTSCTTNSNSPGASTSGAQAELDQNAVNLVSRAIEQNKLGVTAQDLKTKKNPKGEGTFVYVPQTKFAGVERNVIWVVVDSKAFALNSPSKMVTPSLPWPRETDDATWGKTGIDKFSGANEAIKIVFGSE